MYDDTPLCKDCKGNREMWAEICEMCKLDQIPEKTHLTEISLDISCQYDIMEL